MNPFEYINEIREVIKSLPDGNEIITKQQAYQMILNALDILDTELQDAEYNYAIKAIDGELTRLDNFTVSYQQLNEDVILIQPVALLQDLTQTDYDSLREVLEMAHKTGLIKENIIIVPPDINTFTAKLAR